MGECGDTGGLKAPGACDSHRPMAPVCLVWKESSEFQCLYLSSTIQTVLQRMKPLSYSDVDGGTVECQEL